jgi:hypothetical protein
MADALVGRIVPKVEAQACAEQVRCCNLPKEGETVLREHLRQLLLVPGHLLLIR